MSLFTPIPGLVGGSLIGLAAGILLVANGDVMGASGISSPLVLKPKTTLQSQSWKFVFTASFIAAANLYIFMKPDALTDPNNPRSNLSSLGYVIAGMFVGFGTRLGNGCTSGHGICGLARLSQRSFASVGTFMAVAVTTASLLAQTAVAKATSFLWTTADTSETFVRNPQTALMFALVPTAVALYSVLRKPSSKHLAAAVSGGLFGVGLGISKMVLPSKVVGFLDLTGFPRGTYDPTLTTVMGSGVIISFLSYQYKNKLETPLCTSKDPKCRFNVPTNTVIDSKLLLGASCFGIGWGVAGLCPGPALFWAAAGMPNIAFLWLPSYILGSQMADEIAPFMSHDKGGPNRRGSFFFLF